MSAARKYSSDEDGDGPDWSDSQEWSNWPGLSPREIGRRQMITEEKRRRKKDRDPPYFAGGRKWIKAGGRIRADFQEINWKGGVGLENWAGGQVRCPFAIHEPGGLRLECMHSYKPGRHRDCSAHQTELEGGNAHTTRTWGRELLGQRPAVKGKKLKRSTRREEGRRALKSSGPD